MADLMASGFPRFEQSSPSSLGEGENPQRGGGVRTASAACGESAPPPPASPAVPLPETSSGRIALALLAPALLLAAPVAAKDSLGVFGDWGAFRDPEVPRCYAIAAAEDEARDHAPFASVGTWPKREVRGQVHVRLSRNAAPSATISLSVGGQRFELTGSGGDAWAQDRRMDAAIVAAMRSAGSMTVSARDRAGNRFSDRYSLEGAATAMDAATVGCARVR